MIPQTAIEVGQIWKSKNRREVRYVLIDSFGMKNGVEAVWCGSSGRLLDTGRAARVLTVNLPKLYELFPSKQ